MSYSRWSHSTWYTYWDASVSCDDPVLATRLNQKFTVCGVDTFSYRQLKEGIKACIDDCGPENKKDASELEVYMKQFMDDVEEEFNE